MVLRIFPKPLDTPGGEGNVKRAPGAACGSIRPLVEAGLLPVGTELTLRRGATVVARGVVYGGGRIVVDGVAYRSPSDKTFARVLGRQSLNGWREWLGDRSSRSLAATGNHRTSAELPGDPTRRTGHHNPPRIEIGREGDYCGGEDQSTISRHPTQDRPMRRRAAGVTTPPPYPTHVATLHGLPARCRSQGPIREQTRGPRHPRGGRYRIAEDPDGTRSFHQMGTGSVSTASTLCSSFSFLSSADAIVTVTLWLSARKRRARSA